MQGRKLAHEYRLELDPEQGLGVHRSTSDRLQGRAARLAEEAANEAALAQHFSEQGARHEQGLVKG